VPWRYLYVLGRPKARPPHAKASGGAHQEDLVEAKSESLLDRVVGDEVTLGAVTEGYENLVYKTLEALRWALTHTSFEILLKTDDDTVVHVGRLWMWLSEKNRVNAPGVPLARLYAGRIFPGSQVIRANFTRKDLWHPTWFPSDFKKWAVDFDVYSAASYPPYCSGGGYVVGREAARLIVHAYDQLPHGKAIPVEDAFVGVLAHSQGVVPLDAPNFQDPPRGSLQTRDTFIDQVLVHRVVEPYKAFRWLMLSDACFDTKKRCKAQFNRTHDLPYQEPPPMAETNEQRLQDWLNGPIPRRNVQALTGSSPDDLLAAAQPKGKRGKKGAGSGKGAGGSGKRKKTKGGGGRGSQMRRLARARWRDRNA
jgi:hypothetical protein